VSAFRDAPSWCRFVAIATLGLALDLWSKQWAFQSLGQGRKPVVIVPHVLEFQTMLNKGALFGLGAGRTMLFLIASAAALLLVLWMFAQTSPRRRVLQIALGAILAGALGNMYDRVFVRLLEEHWPRSGHAVYMQKVGEDDRGVLIQVYPPREDEREFVIPRDKLPREVGFVRDFIKIPTTLPQWSWIPAKLQGQELWPWVFNVADMLLVGGVAILAVYLWRDRKRPVAGSEIPVDSGDAAA
jgi:signal peptidase II